MDETMVSLYTLILKKGFKVMHVDSIKNEYIIELQKGSSYRTIVLVPMKNIASFQRRMQRYVEKKYGRAH